MGARAKVKPLSVAALEPSGVLAALPEPVFVLDEDDRLAYLNLAAEDFFGGSSASLLHRGLAEWLPPDAALFQLVRQVRLHGYSASEHGITLEGHKLGSRFVSVDVAPLLDRPQAVVVALREQGIARKIDRQLTHRHAARSVTAMAAMLAHEVKNPLSGIRGAAQLLEANAAPADRELTKLICEEADRIVQLVDRMEMFADGRPIERQAVNIHEVLEHVRRLAESGFARNRRIVERYDPSLPPVLGNRDLLIQALINLVKNAAEATPEQGGELLLSTRYQQGVRLAVQGDARRIDLPLVISVQDNGTGIPEDLRPHLFDPFVTTKPNGKGLGLALVAKIIGDHGGVIEFDSEPGRTVVSLFLPIARSTSAAAS